MTNIETHHLKAPIKISTLALGIPQSYKEKCIEEIYRLGDSMNQQTNVKAQMTSYQIWNESHVFDNLLSNIDNIINNVFPIGIPNIRYKTGDTWGAVYKEGHYARKHNHQPALLSWVYYLKSKGDTPLVFDDCDFKVNPMDDALIIFPAYITHSVPKHIGKEDRICLAGNVNWIDLNNK